MIKDIVVGEKVLTHTGELKSIIVNDSVEKDEWLVNTGDQMSFSKNHKHPVFNIESGKIEIVKTYLLDTTKHKLLRKKEIN